MSQLTAGRPMQLTGPMHPEGTNARVLLTSVFGPYAQDDAYGSRLINPMELYHNVTRVQQAFSLRTFNRSWGLMLIQVNLQAPCTLLDFPTENRFVEELKTNQYDVIGISSIMTNLLKVRRMCKLIRKHQPMATIVIGGHIANLAVLLKYADAEHIVRGDGVRWMRKFLGEDEHQPVRHPVVRANIGSRIMGVSLRNPRRCLCDTDSVSWLSDWMQLLFDVSHVWRQRQIHQVLPIRRRTFPYYVRVRGDSESQGFFCHG